MIHLAAKRAVGGTTGGAEQARVMAAAVVSEEAPSWLYA